MKVIQASIVGNIATSTVAYHQIVGDKVISNTYQHTFIAEKAKPAKPDHQCGCKCG